MKNWKIKFNMPRILYLIFLITMPIISIGQDCDKISKDVDEMRGTVSYHSPIGINSIVAFKYANSKDTGYMVRLLIQSSYGSYVQQGAYIKFSNGTFFRKENERVDCNYEGSAGYRYTVYLTISEEMLPEFQNNNIEKIQLGVLDHNVSNKFSNKVKGYFKCLETIK